MWFFWSNVLTWCGHWSGISVWHRPRGLASIHLVPCGNQYCRWCFCPSKGGHTGEGKDAFMGMDEPRLSYSPACSRMAFRRRRRTIRRTHGQGQNLLSGSAWHERSSFPRQETLDMLFFLSSDIIYICIIFMMAAARTISLLQIGIWRPLAFQLHRQTLSFTGNHLQVQRKVLSSRSFR